MSRQGAEGAAARFAKKSGSGCGQRSLFPGPFGVTLRWGEGMKTFARRLSKWVLISLGVAAVIGLWRWVVLGPDGLSGWGRTLRRNQKTPWRPQIAVPKAVAPETADPRSRGFPQAGISSETKLALGGQHVCRLSSGRVACWGFNHDGELGNPGPTQQGFPTEVEGLGVVNALSVGENFTCALVQGVGVSCWGGNLWGQLGTGTRKDRPRPEVVDGLGENILQISGGSYHSCAVAVDGKLYCWGYNESGQLGTGKDEQPWGVQEVAGIGKVKQVSAGGGHTCALLTSGRVNCWGDNRFGQLGDGSTRSSRLPRDVLGLNEVEAIGTGAVMSCALRGDGKVFCWGGESLGTASASPYAGVPGPNLVTKPAPVPGLPAMLRLEVGSSHACGIASEDRSVWCWGMNVAGELGIGKLDDPGVRHAAKKILLSERVSGLFLGEFASFALDAGGRVWFWGQDFGGSSLLGVESAKYASPVQVDVRKLRTPAPSDRNLAR
jgi:hypothetical protein